MKRDEIYKGVRELVERHYEPTAWAFHVLSDAITYAIVQLLEKELTEQAAIEERRHHAEMEAWRLQVNRDIGERLGALAEEVRELREERSLFPGL